jgi:predicted house-cleaning noncanonical NTP pyrophosphatase (MazG superfamily)
MRKFKTELLIRDNRLPLMEQAGLKVDYLILEQKDYLKELKTKLTEEVNEFLLVDNADKKALTEELADILEVINYLKKD